MFLAIAVGVPRSAHAGGDAAAGKARSLACETCHVAVEPSGDTPHIAGQRASYVAKQLKAFKAGDRKNPIMNAIAGQLNEADIDNLAAYWSSQPSGSDTVVSEAAAAIKKSHMGFPKDFPKGFMLYLTSNDAEKKTVARSYISAAGWKAAQANKPLPDGSAIIVVTSSARLDADKKPVVEKDGSWAIDKIVSYSGMEARAGWGSSVPELLRNANWNYGVFTADKAPRPGVNQAICRACHKPQAAVDYVFTFNELRAKATGK
jgi:cytochrome c553